MVKGVLKCSIEPFITVNCSRVPHGRTLRIDVTDLVDSKLIRQISLLAIILLSYGVIT